LRIWRGINLVDQQNLDRSKFLEDRNESALGFNFAVRIGGRGEQPSIKILKLIVIFDASGRDQRKPELKFDWLDLAIKAQRFSYFLISLREPQLPSSTINRQMVLADAYELP